MTESFKIEQTTLNAKLMIQTSSSQSFKVKSVPVPYLIEWLENDDDPAHLINNNPRAILLIDNKIKDLWFPKLRNDLPIFEVDAKETNKNISTAIDFAEFMESIGTTKANMVYVVGGGIMQDIGAFACAMYKRGIPWTYLPTTLLGMADSCIGGKTGLNHKSTKNLMALFAAPRRIVHFLPFIETLPKREIISGFGEALKLHATGGYAFMKCFDAHIDLALSGSLEDTRQIITSSLSVKRAVVEEDEFEQSLRRSMNYGHSIGHAIEALTNFAFPHGMAVSIGVMVENMIAKKLYGLSAEDCLIINHQAAKLIDDEARASLRQMDLSRINSVLQKDKKTLDRVLKMAVPVKLGHMDFFDFPLNNEVPSLIKESLKSAELI
jgi:3-dehydroquinate synthase